MDFLLEALTNWLTGKYNCHRTILPVCSIGLIVNAMDIGISHIGQVIILAKIESYRIKLKMCIRDRLCSLERSVETARYNKGF